MPNRNGLEWVSRTWGDLVELKYGKALKGYKGAKGNFPVFGTNGPVGWCDVPLCDYPSVIIGRKGAYRGVHYSNSPFYVIDTAFFVLPRVDLNLKWVYYSLLTQDINGLDSGSAIPSTRREDFYALVTKVPPRKIQNSIVAQLDALNDKIELNRQMNTTLESMAQALFKSWFVDFDPVIDNALAAGNPIPEPLQVKADTRKALGDKRKPLPKEIQKQFPSSFVFSEEMGWIPEGWESKQIKDFIVVTDFVANGSFASLKSNVTLFDEPEYALYIRTTDYKNGFNPEKAKYVDRHSYEFLKKSRLKGDEVIISNVGDTGTVFKPPRWLNKPMTLGSNAIALRADNMSNFLHLYFSSYFGQYQISGIVGGSAQPKFNKTDFRSLNVYFGSSEIVESFEGFSLANRQKIEALMEQISQLAKLRDILLPKLLSGELCIPDAEKLVADSV